MPKKKLDNVYPISSCEQFSAKAMFLKAGKYMSMDKGPMADKIPRIKIIFVRLAEVGIIEGYIKKGQRYAQYS
jgi:hypothetical protein